MAVWVIAGVFIICAAAITVADIFKGTKDRKQIEKRIDGGSGQ